MPRITLAQAEAKLQEYLDAESAVLASQEYAIAGRSMKHALLADIQAGIELWNTRVIQLSRTTQGMPTRGAVPL